MNYVEAAIVYTVSLLLLSWKGVIMNDRHPAAKAYSRCGINLFVYLLISVLLPVVLLLIYQLIRPYSVLSDVQSLLLSFIPMYLIAFPLYLLMSRKMETAQPEEHTMTIGQILIALLMCEGIAIFGNLLGKLISLLIGSLIPGFTDFSLDSYLSGEMTYVFLFFSVFCAPFVEEIMLRKVLIDRVRKYGDGWAILVSGLLFGLIHGNFTQFFYAAGTGLLLAFIYVRTGRIRYTITLHFLMNLLGSAIPVLLLGDIPLSTLTEATDAELVGMLADLVPYLIFNIFVWMAAIAGVVLIFCSIRKFELTPPIQETKAKHIFLNLGLPLCVIGCIAVFVLNMI